MITGGTVTGKSSLTIQFVENQFVDSYDPTIENSKCKHKNVRDELRKEKSNTYESKTHTMH